MTGRADSMHQYDRLETLPHSLAAMSPRQWQHLCPDRFRLNANVIPQLVDFLIERGVGGLFVGGTTGEAAFCSVMLNADSCTRYL